MTDRENEQIDAEIVDQERAAEMKRIAGRVIDDEDWARRTAVREAEEDIERQLIKLECDGLGEDPKDAA